VRRSLLLALLAPPAAAASAVVLAFGASAGRTAATSYVLTAGSDFGLSGSVGNLTPGVAATLILRATNPYGRPITIRSVTATLPAAPPGCPAGYLSLSGASFTGSPPTVSLTGLAVTVPARWSADISVPILLARSAGNQCQDITDDFAFGATATAGPARPLQLPAPCRRALPIRPWCQGRP